MERKVKGQNQYQQQKHFYMMRSLKNYLFPYTQFYSLIIIPNLRLNNQSIPIRPYHPNTYKNHLNRQSNQSNSPVSINFIQQMGLPQQQKPSSQKSQQLLNDSSLVQKDLQSQDKEIELLSAQLADQKKKDEQKSILASKRATMDEEILKLDQERLKIKQDRLHLETQFQNRFLKLKELLENDFSKRQKLELEKLEREQKIIQMQKAKLKLAEQKIKHDNDILNEGKQLQNPLINTDVAFLDKQNNKIGKGNDEGNRKFFYKHRSKWISRSPIQTFFKKFALQFSLTNLCIEQGQKMIESYLETSKNSYQNPKMAALSFIWRAFFQHQYEGFNIDEFIKVVEQNNSGGDYKRMSDEITKLTIDLSIVKHTIHHFHYFLNLVNIKNPSDYELAEQFVKEFLCVEETNFLEMQSKCLKSFWCFAYHLSKHMKYPMEYFERQIKVFGNKIFSIDEYSEACCKFFEKINVIHGK